MWGFGRAIALWGFNAVQQFRAGTASELCRKVLIAVLALTVCSMQIALPNRTTFPATREAGLLQISSAVSTVLDRQSSACRRFWSEHCGYGDLC